MYTIKYILVQVWMTDIITVYIYIYTLSRCVDMWTTIELALISNCYVDWMSSIKVNHSMSDWIRISYCIIATRIKSKWHQLINAKCYLWPKFEMVIILYVIYSIIKVELNLFVTEFGHVYVFIKCKLFIKDSSGQIHQHWLKRDNEEDIRISSMISEMQYHRDSYHPWCIEHHEYGDIINYLCSLI